MRTKRESGIPHWRPRKVDGLDGGGVEGGVDMLSLKKFITKMMMMTNFC